MSPDETSTEAQTETGEAEAETEAKPKKSMKERMAFLDKSGKPMDKVPGLNKIPRAARVLVIIVVLILIFSIVYVALPSGEDPPEEPKTINTDNLEEWSWTSGVLNEPLLNEGSTGTFKIAEMVPENGTIFLDSIDITITWQDEPDQAIGPGPRVKENEPDTFQIEVNGTANVTGMSEMMSNTHGSSQSISLSVDADVSGYTYLVLGNVTGLNLGDDVVQGDLNVMVHMIEAGDYHSPPPEFVYINDFGNEYTIEITASGKIMSE